MHHTTLIEGEYVHNSMGYNLSESDNFDSVLNAMIDWIVNRPNADYPFGSERVERKGNSESILYVTEVSKRWSDKGMFIDAIYFRCYGNDYRVFPNSVSGQCSTNHFESRYHIVRTR
jgi:hypothetical protein